MNHSKLRELQNSKKHHGISRFRNNHKIDRHGLDGFMKWYRDARKSGRSPFARPQKFKLNKPSQQIYQPGNDILLTWIGHSTFLFQKDGVNVLTDPVFSDRCAPVQFAGPKRVVEPPLSIDELPEIDYVLISHSHYDHLDYDSVMQLAERSQERKLTFLVPQKLKAWFGKHGIANVIELDWWDVSEISGINFYCVPVQHFSGRTPLDRNHTLWCGWVMEINGYQLFFAGDTGYCEDFKLIGEVFGEMDLSLLPIGAYEPRWFMRYVHTNPADAVKIHMDVNSKLSVGMHWGTFILTAEPMNEPPKALAKALDKYGVDPSSFIVMEHGETRTMILTDQLQALLN